MIRQSFVLRHGALANGRPVPWRYAVIGTLMLLGVAAWQMPPPKAAVANAPPVTFAMVQGVITQRCVLCHNAELQNKAVALHTPALIQQHAQNLYQQAVVLKLMPLNNATQITDAERELLKRWFEAGAPGP